MLSNGLKLKGYAIEATDGTIGTVADALFDDRSWMVRWIVVKTGSWFNGREVLIHPSAVLHTDHALRRLSVALTVAQVKGAPDIATDEPVSRQMYDGLYGYYGWDPLWGGSGYLGMWPTGSDPAFGGGDETMELDRPELAGAGHGDPGLRSIGAVAGYHLLATDGSIGHVEDFVIDDTNWAIHYLAVDTKNWWPGRHVLISPYAVHKINWLSQDIELNLSRDKIQGSPTCHSEDLYSNPCRAQLHDYYGWTYPVAI